MLARTLSESETAEIRCGHDPMSGLGELSYFGVCRVRATIATYYVGRVDLTGGGAIGGGHAPRLARGGALVGRGGLRVRDGRVTAWVLAAVPDRGALLGEGADALAEVLGAEAGFAEGDEVALDVGRKGGGVGAELAQDALVAGQ